MYRLCFYVPKSHLEAVKSAVFEVGAGKIGNYDMCCWQTKGEGQFRALAGSAPFIGWQGSLERVEEYKVEMVCADGLIEAAVRALQKAHPYEEPAFSAVQTEDFGTKP